MSVSYFATPEHRSLFRKGEALGVAVLHILPEDPAPKQVEDMYAAWLSANTDDFWVGSAGLVICYDSAGSGIAEERV